MTLDKGYIHTQFPIWVDINKRRDLIFLKICAYYQNDNRDMQNPEIVIYLEPGNPG